MKKDLPQIWIDGDSCPSMLRDFVFSYAERREFSAFFICNKKILSDEQSKYEIIAGSEKDAADDYILSHAKSSDIIITKDIPFAARALEKEICAINDRGGIFTKENIAKKLADREYDLSLAEIGFKSPREKNYGKAEFGKFVATFEKEMKRLVRELYQL